MWIRGGAFQRGFAAGILMVRILVEKIRIVKVLIEKIRIRVCLQAYREAMQ
jgi:hypothetical protein